MSDEARTIAAWGLSALIVSMAVAQGSRSSEASQAEIEVAAGAFVEAVFSSSRAGLDSAREALTSLEPDPEEIVDLLRQGRTHDGTESDDSKKGVLSFTNSVAGEDHPVTIVVPDAYDGARIPVRIMLHGGVSRAEPRVSQRGLENFLGLGHITVLPSAWNDSKWWHESQVVNLELIFRRLSRDYNIDTNRVTVSGISDGATGAFFLSMRDSSRYSSLLTFIGFLQVLANVDVEDQLHLSNLINLPIYSVNTTNDRLYPFARVRPTLSLLQKSGGSVVIREQEGGHDTNWYGRERSSIDDFIEDHPRDPYPERVSWATADPQRSGRHSWLVIDRLSAKGAAPNDLNALDGRRIFPRGQPFGHVSIERNGRRFVAQAAGVECFRILLSSQLVSLSAPIEVVVNGREVFSGVVEPSLAVLLDWYQQDFDPERLYLAEIELTP